LRVTSVVAHGPGTKLLHGLAEASTNGVTAYAYRRRAGFLKRDTVEKGPCGITRVPYCYCSGRRTVGHTPSRQNCLNCARSASELSRGAAAFCYPPA